MIYRRKTYKLATQRVEIFNELFNEYLLPAQWMNGAKLIGRWMTDADENETVEVFALWEYDSFEDYQEVERKIRSNKEHVERVQKRLNELDRQSLFKEPIKEEFIKSTVLRNKTILKD